MSTISPEKKMQLARIIRDEHQNNRVKMQSREELLYGKRSYYDNISSVEKQDKTVDSNSTNYSSSLRFLIAVFLLISFILWDNSQISVMGKSPDTIYTWLKDESVMTNIFDFMENITYTEENVKTSVPDINAIKHDETQND